MNEMEKKDAHVYMLLNFSDQDNIVETRGMFDSCVVFAFGSMLMCICC